MHPIISVVIPVYNVEKYLNKCVDSVLSQSFTDYEILLIDDGSTDNSGKLCDNYAEKYPFISVIHQKNNGLGGARNTGIANACGDYILFLDSDDTIDRHLLEICYEKADRYACDMVLFDSIALYEDETTGVVYSCRPVPSDRPISKNDLKPMVFLSGACNRMFKSSLFKDFNIYFPERLWYEDLYTMPKFIPHIESVYYYSEKPLHYYLQRSGSIMHTPDFNRIIKERIKAVEEIWGYYAQNGFADIYREELEFLWLFHGFLLPVREMQLMSPDFRKYVPLLRENLLKKCEKPYENKYITTLSRKEQLLFKWALNENYATIKIFSAINKFVKKVRNVK